MSDLSPDAKTSDPRRLAKFLILVGILVAIGLKWGLPHVIRLTKPPYVVSAGEMILRPDIGWGRSPGVLSVEIEVEANRRVPIARCELVLESMHDGTSELLNAPLTPGPFASTHGMVSIFYNNGISSHWRPNHRGSDFSFRVNAPQLPDPGVTQVSMVGHLDILEGGEPGSTTIDDFPFKKGHHFTVDGTVYEVVNFSPAWKGHNHGSVAVVGPVSDTVIHQVKSAGLNDLSHNNDTVRTQLLPPRSGQADQLHFSFDVPAGAKTGTITFSYVSECVSKRIPFEVKGPVTTELIDSSQPGFPAILDEQNSPTRWPPTDEQWGLPIISSSPPIVSVQATRISVDDDDPRYSDTTITLQIEVVDPSSVTATTLSINQLENGEGQNLLEDFPLRSSEYRELSLERAPSKYGGLQYRLKCWSIGELSGTGTCRVAWGSGELASKIPNVIPTHTILSGQVGTGRPLKIDEDLELIPRRVLPEMIEFRAVGNLGRLRKLSALDSNGQVIASETPGTHPYFSHEAWFYFETDSPFEAIHEWEAVYFKKSEWMEVPFEFRIPASTDQSVE